MKSLKNQRALIVSERMQIVKMVGVSVFWKYFFHYFCISLEAFYMYMQPRSNFIHLPDLQIYVSKLNLNDEFKKSNFFGSFLYVYTPPSNFMDLSELQFYLWKFNLNDKFKKSKSFDRVSQNAKCI